jgi:hypothetical protein
LNEKLERMREEEVIALVRIIYQEFSGGTEENH